MFIRSVDDLSDSAVAGILARADQHATGNAIFALDGKIVGLVFLDASLRTRVGFAVGAARLGIRTVEVSDQRQNSLSMPETVDGTLRVVAGYVDAVVARVCEELTPPSDLTAPLISGGDRGPRAEHPTQTLIDFFALRRYAGPIADLSLALCGDLRMRSARSLLKLLTRYRPRKLLLVTDAGLASGFDLPPELEEISEHRTITQLDDADVLYVVGIPHGAADEASRTRLRVTPQTLASLSSTAVVLSPLPVIDEISPDAFTNHRLRVFQQSDDGLYVRMAVLEYLLGQRIS